LLNSRIMDRTRRLEIECAIVAQAMNAKFSSLRGTLYATRKPLSPEDNLEPEHPVQRRVVFRNPEQALSRQVNLWHNAIMKGGWSASNAPTPWATRPCRCQLRRTLIKDLRSREANGRTPFASRMMAQYSTRRHHLKWFVAQFVCHARRNLGLANNCTQADFVAMKTKQATTPKRPAPSAFPACPARHAAARRRCAGRAGQRARCNPCRR
jgi:hypothetical protein